MQFNIKDRFNQELPADKILENSRRQVKEACFSYVTPKIPSKPSLIHVSPEMLENLGLTEAVSKTEEFLNVVTGAEVIPNTKPYAMCYAGHQFGNWAGQLGDGRAINLTEIEHNNKHWALQLKGAGETPYSRSADGLAVLRSSIREYLCSEAMFHLGVPTTRALSLSLSGDDVLRDVMYNGNAAYEKGAIVSRVAESFLRFGSYEIFASKGDAKTLKTLVDYTIRNHYSELGEPSKDTYIAFLKAVTKRSLDMVVHWQRVGFVHGVMNTDNMSILGLTIDYGPYGWLEGYDQGWTPNTTDNTHKRYRFGTQPHIVLWNLIQLANALYPLVEEAEPLEEILNNYQIEVQLELQQMMRSKLGLKVADRNDIQLIEALENVLQLSETDMTIFFRNLANLEKENTENWYATIENAFYKPEEISGEIKLQWSSWFKTYEERLTLETLSDAERKSEMNKVNPKYVLRNYMAQLAIDDADKGNYDLIDEFFKLLKKPYDEQPNSEKWFAKRPEWARDKVGCSMLSCSS
ncbi:protein adenylyltransferase SelO [Winogradskyella endarachnes]|uniref:Protein nucleotidyltransferase YdiU n=1 Tax=Winogradskyella endarachnes TaxID=2681965 RepID=A0A6L6U6B8_9FLAO|nr:YdiU family protein [Winogradskyella endarachnes]MUU77479.1 YdiU family protein [Winogradskyella endarachnes]